MDEKEEYLKDLYEDFRYSIGKFDSQTLAISAGALGFSLTFIKDIVPFNEAKDIYLLYISISLFIYSIVVGFIGHYLSIRQISKSIDILTDENFSELKTNNWIPKINLSLIFSIFFGIVLLVIYCVINIENERKKCSNNEISFYDFSIQRIKFDERLNEMDDYYSLMTNIK